MQDILLLHGAIGAKDQLQLLADVLKDKYRVYTLNSGLRAAFQLKKEEYFCNRNANRLQYLGVENQPKEFEIKTMKFKHLNPNCIANTRAKLNMSQSQFAALLGISKSAVGLAEIGRRNLPAAVRDRYAALKAKLDADNSFDISRYPLRNTTRKPKPFRFKK